MTIFLSLLVKPVWTLFYGTSYYGPQVYKYFVYTALIGGFYTIIINTLQGINKYKLVITTVIIGLITNAVLDVPLMILFHKLGLNVSYGAITAAILGYSLSILISLYTLKKKYNFSFKTTINRLPHYIYSWIVFIITILLLKLIIPTNLSGRLINVFVIGIYGLVSFIIYFYINYKNGNLKLVFGNNLTNKIKRILKRTKESI